MIKFFRKIRQSLLAEGKFTQYLKYAFGEIVLVVIGILIALSINNWNEGRKEREKEKKYLISLKADLEVDLKNLERRSNSAHQKTLSAIKILELEPPTSQEELYFMDSLLLRVSIWNTFSQRASTVDELTSSGNLSLIKNDSIKTLLLSLKQGGVHLKAIDHHIRQEFDKFIYPAVAREYEEFAFFNFQELTDNDTLVYENRIEESRLPILIAEAENLLQDKLFRNGLRLAAVNFKGVRMNYGPMLDQTKELIALIDEDLNTENQ